VRNTMASGEQIHRDAPSASNEPAPLPRRRARSRRVVVIATLLASLIVVPIAIAAAGAWQATNLLSSIPRDESFLPLPEPAVTTPSAQSSPLNILICGSDTTDGTRGRCDALLVAHLNADRDRLHLVSLPRDLYVAIPGHGKSKINAAYAWGGMALTVRTVEQLLGIRIDHAIAIDFEGFVALSDRVGGITFWNETNSENLGFHFRRGQITLRGDALLAYVRQRRGLCGGDLDRAQRHRIVLKALALKLGSPDNLADPKALVSILDRIRTLVTVDARLTDARILEIAMSLQLSSSESIVTLQAPVRGFGTTSSGASIDRVDPLLMADLAEAFQTDALQHYVEAHDADDSPG